MKLEFSGQIFEKSSSIKLKKNRSNGSWVPGGLTDKTKLIVAFPNIANAPKEPLLFTVWHAALTACVAILSGHKPETVRKVKLSTHL
jgi:hypothetical protein